MPESPRPLPELVLGDAVIERDALARTTPGLVPGLLDDATTRVLVLQGDRAPITSGTLVWRAPAAADRAWYEGGGVVLYLGRVGARAAVAVLGPAMNHDEPGRAETPAATPADALTPDPAQVAGLDGAQWLTLRDTGLDLPADDVAAFTAALALTHWHATHRHCPRCGARTEPREAGWVRRCLVDGSQHFPRTDPAVIMAVIDEEDGDADTRTTDAGDLANDASTVDHQTPADDGSRILLARGSRWRGNHRSVLAGFVEPGESFEQAVARETFEESGVRVADVRYLGSQPWPFPASLMVGCIARATTTDLTPQAGEIEEIAWYSRTDIAQGIAAGTLTLPGRLSIARALIEHWYGGPLPEPAAPSTPNGAS